MTTLKRLLAAAAMAGATILAAAPAHAGGNVYWSIGINAPLDPYGASIGTTISNAPAHVYHRPAPVYVQPAPIYYTPAPVYYQPPVVVRPRPVYRVQPAPVYVPYAKWHKRDHWKHRDHDRHDRHDRRHRRDRHDD